MQTKVIKTLIEGLLAQNIAQLLNSGQLSPRLTDCAGDDICATTAMVACREFTDLLIKNIKVDKVIGPLLSGVSYEDGTFTFTFATDGDEPIEIEIDSLVFNDVPVPQYPNPVQSHPLPTMIVGDKEGLLGLPDGYVFIGNRKIPYYN